MLSSLNNQNVSAPLLQTLTDEQPKKPQNANVFKDATQFSVELKEKQEQGQADMPGLLGMPAL